MMHHIFQLLFGVMAMVGVFSAVQGHVRNRKLAQLGNLLAGGDPVLAAASAPSMADEPPLPRAIVRNLRQLGVMPRNRDCILGFAGLGLALIVIGLAAGPLAAAWIGATVILIGWSGLNVMAARRVARLGEQVPGFLDRLRQMLIVGNSLPTAFARTVSGSQPALSKFFDPTLRRIHNGAAFPESIQQSAEDIDLYEMRLFAGAVSANMRFGGSLTQALNNLVTYLRKRAAIERELRASTAQIRASAWVLGLLPMAVAASIILQNREYADWFVVNTLGRKLLVYCAVSQVLGAVLMRRIVRSAF